MRWRTGWLLVLACVIVSAAVTIGGSAPAAAAGDDRAKALDYLGQGDNSYRMGDLVEATQHWQEAIGFCRIAGDAALESQALAKRGEALEMLGQYRDAVDDLGAALDAADKIGNPAQLAAVSGALGNVYFQTNEPDKARPLLTKSLDLARQDGLQPVIAASANNYGNLLAATDDTAGAAASYQEALAAARSAGDAELAVTIETNQARLLARGDGRPLVAALGPALDGALALPASRDKIYALIAIGTVAKPARGAPAARGDAATLAARQALAYKALRAATQLAEDRHDSRAASLGWGNIAELYESAHRDREAAQLGDRAIVLAQETGASDILYRWEWLEGRLANAAGDRDAAIGAYRRAVAALETVRPNIPVEYVDGRSSYRDTVGPLYVELVDLLLRKSASLGHDSPDVKPILNEARDTIETLKTAEVRDYFKEQCLAAPEAKRTAVEQAGGGDSRRTAVLYPIILPDRVELLLSFSDGPQQFTSPVDAATLNAAVRKFRPAIETLGKRDYAQPAERLYDWLIRPLEPALAQRKIDTLVVIPDGSLRTIPFAALYDGKEFLVAKYALATAPGLTLIDPRPIERQANARVLLAGLSKSVQGYAALDYVSDELSSIGKHYGGTVLSNESFRLTTVEQSLKTVPYSVVHLASHGEFDSDPDKTYILTYDSKLTLDDLEDAIKYSQFRKQPLELLTLSACRTAAGDDKAALGLAGVAIKAGARSAVASLWFVSDEASTHLIELFYDHLSAGLSKAKAMQQAQLEMIADRRFRHPGYWSPFLVIGNWL